MGRFLLLLLACASPAFAQEADEVEALVVTGSIYAVSIDSAATHVEVIRRGELEAAPPGGLGDAVASRPGVRSSAFGPGASRPIIRGQSGPRVLVLQNGVGLVDASTLSPDHAVAADPGASERIEILRGPSTLAYGGSAIGGVVNVIDERVATGRPDGPLSGRIAASAGGPGGGFAAQGSLAAAIGDVVLTAEAAHHDRAPYRTPATPVAASLAAREGWIADPRRLQLNTGVEFGAYGGGISLVGEHGHFGMAVKQTDTRYGLPFAQLTSPLDPEGEGPVEVDLSQIRYDLRAEQRGVFGPFERMRLLAGYADYEHREKDAAGPDVHTVFQSTGAEARIELLQSERRGWQGAVGVQGLSRDLEAIGEEAFVPPSRIGEQGLFVLQRRDFGAWGLEGGLRVDRRTVTARLSGRDASDAARRLGVDWTAANAERSFSGVSVSAAAFWRPAEGAFLALVGARNVRAPTELELFADGPHPGTSAFEVGDPALRSEAVTSIELTGRWKRGRVSLEGHVFAADYEGYIDQRPTGTFEDGLPVFRFVATDARFVGAEAEAGIELWRRGERSISLALGADMLNASSDVGPPARMPPASITGRIAYEGARIDGLLEVRSVAHQDRLAPFELATDGHTTLNARVEWRPRTDAAFRLYLDARNLTGATVREHVSFLKDIVVQPGRTIRTGLTVAF